MTLILNEIHVLSGLNKSLIVAAADRRISKLDGSYDSTRRKLFPIPSFNGAVSYFGLAMVFPKGKRIYLSDWLPNFITRNVDTQSIGEFAELLREELNRIVPPSILHDYPSGFHICGYDGRGYPDFWYISNIGNINNFQYIGLKTKYEPAASHFLQRDAKNAGWDGVDSSTMKLNHFYYRNGDYRAHVAAWELLDDIFARLGQFPDFKLPQNSQEYRDYVKFKFEIIAYFYKHWAKKQIIARPIDVLVYQKEIYE